MNVEVRRPGWLGWALGSERHEQLTLRAPVAHVTERWMTVPTGSPVQRELRRAGQRRRLRQPGTADPPHAERRPELGLARDASRRPERPRSPPRRAHGRRVGAPTQVSWFPPSHSPVMVTLPAAGARDRPRHADLPDVLKAGERSARLDPPAALAEHAGALARGQQPHARVHPVGLRRGVRLPAARAAPAHGRGDGRRGQRAAQDQPGRMDGAARLDAAPAAAARRRRATCRSTGSRRAPTVARTPSAQAQAAVDPPRGSFNWRYPNTPHQLQAMWTPGQANTITRGAVMKFENDERHDRRRRGGAGRVAHAAQRRDRRQAPEQRLQLRVRAPRSARRR